MRRKFIISMVLVILPLLSSQATERKNLAEIFVNTSCTYSDDAEIIMDSLAQLYHDDITIIRYHSWWPSSEDPFYVYNSDENVARFNYYDVDGIPTLLVDGITDCGQSSNYNDCISSALQVESGLELGIRGNFNSVSRTGDLIIDIIGTGYISESNLKIRIALTESEIYFAAPNSRTIHQQIFRDMIPFTDGQYFTIQQGDTLQFVFPFTYPQLLEPENGEIVAFIQSDDTKEILQSSNRSLLSLSGIMPFGLISPTDNSILLSDSNSFIWHSTILDDSTETVYYNSYIDDDHDFSSPILSGEILDTSYSIIDTIERSVMYYWKVLAYYSDENSIFSNESWNFYIDGFPTQPTIISPTDNEIVDTLTLFTWLEGTDPDSFDIISYTLQMDNDPQFNSLDINQSGILSGAALEDAIAISLVELDGYENLVDGTKYYWRIRTDDAYGLSSTFTSGGNCFYYNSLPYFPGDCNMAAGLWPPALIGSDVTYLVNYFRGLSDACIIDGYYCSGDANGDCLVIGSDVTKLVNYFRGLTDLSWCPDYEPAWPAPDDLPAEAPEGWPNCEE
ncbi:MAG: Omp28-related outer membrane protein [candidate division Zixibacteria bacterium]|nr:Omp28-related outer membrane protein [candidate division Zixibacteria bacterium]